MTSIDPAPHPDVVLRRGTPDDAPALAEVHLAARHAAFPAMPAPVHDDDAVRGWVRGWAAGGDEVWVAEVAGRAVGYARLSRDWLDDLYVAPAAAGQGIGSALLDLVKALRPGGFSLWVFASNVPARRFYRRHGMREVEWTDGAGNEEGEPDVRAVWP